jgi:hypothetical protein
MQTWELLSDHQLIEGCHRRFERLEIPGGWIYRSTLDWPDERVVITGVVVDGEQAIFEESRPCSS